MTLLTALNWVQRQCSLPTTTAIVANTEESQQLLLALAQEEAEELAARCEWPALRASHVFAATAAQLQTNGLPSDFDRMCVNSFWNRTRDTIISGPLDSRAYQTLQALSTGASALSPQWMRRADGLHVIPAPTALDSLAYDYIINTPVESSGAAAQETFEADTDVFLLGDDLLKRGVRWRYLAQKGLDYAEHMKTYERRVQARINQKTGSGEIDLTASRETSGWGMPSLSEGDWDG